MNSDKILMFTKHLKESFEDDTLVVLKGHLLLETALKNFICRRVKTPARIENAQISFPSLIAFASSLEDGSKFDWLWSALKKANHLRNQLAHNLSPEKLEELKSDFISYVTSKDGEFSIEIDDTPLKYNQLALSFFQIFDVLLHAGPATAPTESDLKIKDSFLKALASIANESA